MKRDLAQRGDQTTALLFPQDRTEVGRIIARERGILAGAQELTFIAKQYLTPQMEVRVHMHKKDGDTFDRGDLLCELKGSLIGILQSERMIVNLLARMSGVATKTAQFVAHLSLMASPPLLTATRKTLWGLLDKRAVGVGGGATHRLTLSDAILIKDTHLDPLGRNITRAIGLCLEKPRALEQVIFFEIEVQSLHEALASAEALAKVKDSIALPMYILLDNMSVGQIQETIFALKNRDLADYFGVEVSGGIREENILLYAKTGAQILSSGALTHSARSLDLSLKIL